RHRTTKIYAAALRYDAMNADITAKPRVIPIENFAELDPVGVLKPCCITRIGRTGPSATSHRSCCKIPAEYPARRRDRRPETLPSGAPANGLGSEGRKLYLPALQQMVSDQRSSALLLKLEEKSGSGQKQRAVMAGHDRAGCCNAPGTDIDVPPPSGYRWPVVEVRD
ncbi:hypothetical protein, partial [Bosea sp. (in: a-proteobacteria)]|uniref:hypothetical protein n=1 Tax=Bosea sp. (in: a-proteobacteria) TaxID=1871050 RepID=UPI0031FF43AF